MTQRSAPTRWMGLFTVIMAGVVFAVGLVSLQAAPASEGLVVRLASPRFALTDQQGRPFSSEALRGNVWIADFVFTSCAGPCPLMSQRMSELQTALADAEEVRFVSFTVDPERDTPEVLREYAAAYDAGPRWTFLTGDRDAIYDMSLNGFKLTAVDQRSVESGADAAALATAPAVPREQFDHMIMHSTNFVLVDHAGAIRGYFNSIEPDRVDALQRAARVLARDVRVPPAVSMLPAVNATLNGAATLLLIFAFIAIRQRNIGLHATLMMAAVASSILFLASYVTYHAFAGSTRFTETGVIRGVYLFILLTHVVLAVVIVPLVIMVLRHALGRRFDKHRRLARVTLPLWLYVSITGVVVYWMLYHVYPAPGLRL
jgi:protein SCO1/2/putative membrane protein